MKSISTLMYTVWHVDKYKILDFKLLPCFEYCMYSFGHFPGVRLTIGSRGNTQKNTYKI